MGWDGCERDQLLHLVSGEVCVDLAFASVQFRAPPADVLAG